MPHYVTRGLRVVVDLALLSLAFWAAFLFRFELQLPQRWVTVALISWPYVVAFEFVVLGLFGVHRFSWRYISIGETVRMGAALATASLFLVSLRVGAIDIAGLDLPILPFGVLATNFFLGLVLLMGIRASRRLYGEARQRKLRADGGERTRVILIGAGEAGVLVAREIASRPDLRLEPVGFVDDDPHKQGIRIGGLHVLGTTAQLIDIAETKRVKRALITIANASGDSIRRVTTLCREGGLDVKIIPGIYEILGDHVNLSRIREVAIEDLLGREPVQLDEAQLNDSLGGSVVLVTGAGGSIGSELCRQVCRFAPAKLILVERFENALFEIHRELVALHPDLVIIPAIGDVCDQKRMEQVFSEHRPATVFHAAAHKHVPMMESNPGEAVKNNIGGTRIVANLADRTGVARFVMISTDKAVNPTSVMGASKRAAEIYTQALAARSKTRFVTVRFGNVLGSNGSVIPIFKQQIAAGGPVTVTHPEMRRYFMTIPEASQLVLQAGAMGQGGEIFILDMGEPVKIVDLARDLISLSGFRPDIDMKIRFSGVRPGEKLFEELSTDAESADKTKHPKIFIGRVRSAEFDRATAAIDELLALAGRAEADAIRNALRALIPEFTGGEVPPTKPQTRRATTASDTIATVP